MLLNSNVVTVAYCWLWSFNIIDSQLEKNNTFHDWKALGVAAKKYEAIIQGLKHAVVQTVSSYYASVIIDSNTLAHWAQIQKCFRKCLGGFFNFSIM